MRAQVRATKGLSVEPAWKPWPPPHCLSTLKFSEVWPSSSWMAYSVFWAMVRMLPVPASTEVSAWPAPSDSLLGTEARRFFSVSFWSVESIVVRMVSPPRSSRACRDWTSGPNVGSARICRST